MERAAIFVLVFLLAFTCSSHARSIIPLSQPLSSSTNINAIQTQNQENCSYAVNIKTSCSSPPFTRDTISLVFGDGHGNQVFVPRIDDPFGRCSLTPFIVNGPCANPLCYLYLHRSGSDGWVPFDVIVIERNSSPVRFFYNVSLPEDVWYGFNDCRPEVAATSSSSRNEVRAELWFSSE